MTNYKKLVSETVLQESDFVKVVFTGGSKQWVKAIVRPVVIKGKKLWQFSYFDNKKDITKNYALKEASSKLRQVLQSAFRNINLQTTDNLIQIEIPKKGNAIIHQHAVEKGLKPVSTSHDQEKNYLLSPDEPIPFLQQVGIMTTDGKVRADKQHKFKQINEFLRIINQTVGNGVDPVSTNNMHIVDYGCGSGYLTLAVYYYFAELQKKNVQMTGVDINEEVLTKLTTEVQTLGWERIAFEKSSIITFQPQEPADIVLALHACDTATDEALAQAIRMQSSYIFSSPCCHHNLQVQLEKSETPSLFHPVFRNRILRERMGDILTDTFRSLILQIMGYKTDIIEFVSSEHTAKNILIRAVQSDTMRTAQYIHEYKALKKYWKVTPYLETLLGNNFVNQIT